MEGGYERYMLLPGQRFCPMEDELLMYYLKPKVNGEEVPGKEALICELDLYGEQEPWNIWETYAARRANDLRRNKDLYFFTKKKKVSAKASRISRKVGSGAWKGQDAAKEIYLLDQNQQPTTTLLGFKKTYTYKNTSSVHHGRWIMYEFELAESQLLHKQEQVNKNDYSLCLLRNNDILPQKKKRKLRQEEENHEMLQAKKNVPAPSLLDFPQLEKWYDQQQFLLPAEPQPSEENLGQQCQIPTLFSANEIMSDQDKNQLQQMPAEEGILTPGEVDDLYGGNLSDVMVGANWPDSFIGELVTDDQPYTMEEGEWNDFLVQILST